MRKDRWLWAVLILGAALRLYGLGDRSLSYDECQQFWASQGNPLISSREITLDPPLFAALLHVHSLASRAETWLRLLPCLFGILAIPAVYHLARSASRDVRTARTAAFFFALAPYPIRYSQSLRVYSLTLLLCALLPAAFLAAREQGTARRRVDPGGAPLRRAPDDVRRGLAPPRNGTLSRPDGSGPSNGAPAGGRASRAWRSARWERFPSIS